MEEAAAAADPKVRARRLGRNLWILVAVLFLGPIALMLLLESCSR